MASWMHCRLRAKLAVARLKRGPRRRPRTRFGAAGSLDMNTQTRPKRRNAMPRFEDSIDVNVPVRTAYNQWTQFESFPQFMEGVERVAQLDDKTLDWTATIAGQRKQWTAEIVEQRPDELVSWRSTSGARNDGAVRFETQAPDRTKVIV